MHFHPNCLGRNIILTNKNTIATRSKSYYHGITFSDKPHKLGELVTFLLVKENKTYTGRIRFGLTNHNPDEIDSLPPFSIPDFSSKSGTWMRELSEQHNNEGSKIGLVFSNDGSMSLFVDGECVETCDLCGAVDVSEPVWIVIDVYGSITSVRLIPSEADIIPVEILSHSIEAKKAYQQAFSHGTKKVNRTRLMIVGQERAGKTSLKKTLIGTRFQKNEEVTDGIDTTTVCAITSGDTWKICKRDCDGENRAKTEYAQAMADYMVKKLTTEDDDDEEETEADAATNIPHDNQAASDLSTNTDNLGDITVPEEVIEEVERCLREQRQIGHRLPAQAIGEDSMAGDEDGGGINLAVWDFGGHSFDHATHQVFLSNRAVYIVVFNLSHDLNQKVPIEVQKVTDNPDKSQTQEQEFTTLEHLDFWLRSIFTYTTTNERSGKMLKQLSPPIFIVGTHRNALDSNPNARQKMVKEKFAQIRQHLKNKHYRQHVVNPFYDLENSLDDSHNEKALSLRKHLYSVLREEPYMGGVIPIRWLLIEDAIKKSVEKGIHFLTLEQIKELTHSLGMESDQDLFKLLQFYHDLGHIIYYGGEKNDDHQALNDLVILDPKWLIGVFKRVLTVMDLKEQWSMHMDAWTRLDNEGVLEDILIDHMWSHLIDLKPALIELMTKFDLICPLTQDQDSTTTSGGICYYVPSLMKDHHDHATPSKTSSATVFYIDFDGFLPDGIFHRLLARTVSWSQAQGGCLLHYRYAILYADDLHQLELVMSTSHHAMITVIITREAVFQTSADTSQDKEDRQPNPITCSKVKAFLSTSLEVLTQTYAKPIQYSFHLDCPCDTGVPHTIDLDQCLTKDILMCRGRSRIDTAGIKKQFPIVEGCETPLSRDSGDPSSITSSSMSSSSASFSSVESENKIATVLESDVKIIGRIGGGGFGVVFHGIHKHWGDVAVKQLNFSEGVLDEAKQMWRTISSPFLVRIMGIMDDPDHPAIIMEYFKHGSLKGFMKYMTNTSNTLPRRVKLIFDITRGMNYLHTKPSPIVHRDLKCDNVFVDEGFKAKIGDMGLAVKIKSVKTREAAEMAGTDSHIPPEVLAKAITKPTPQWDVYSFGITLYEILTNGKDPWPQLNVFANYTLLDAWLRQGLRPDLDNIPDTMPEDLIKIMKKCWDGEPTKRPSFQKLHIQLGKMYKSKYEDDIYKADKAIMDVIQKTLEAKGEESDAQTVSTQQETEEW